MSWLLKDTEEDLFSQYQTDIIGCHPGNDLPPITFEQYKMTKSMEFHEINNSLGQTQSPTGFFSDYSNESQPRLEVVSQ